MGRSTASKASEAVEAAPVDEMLAMLDEGIEDEVVTEVEAGEAIEGAAAIVGASRTVPPVEYVIERDGKDILPVRFLPKSLWGSVSQLDEGMVAHVTAAEKDGKNVVEELLCTTGSRSFERLFALLPQSNPKDSLGFAIDKKYAARSYVVVFTGTDPAVPMSGDMKLVSMVDVSTPADSVEKVIVPAHYFKNRIIVAEDGSTMTVICGARTSVSYGNKAEEKVYLNVGAAGQCAKRSVSTLRGRARECYMVMKALSWVHSMTSEHEGALKREAHLLACVALKNVYYGRPKGAKEDAKSYLQGSISLVADPNFMLTGEHRVQGKTVWSGTHFHIG